jgi:hypothetical protein
MICVSCTAQAEKAVKVLKQYSEAAKMFHACCSSSTTSEQHELFSFLNQLDMPVG